MSENNKAEHPQTMSDAVGAVMCSTPAVSPIIFLDVDGVLNSHQWFEKQEKSGVLETIEGHIDPDAVRRLNTIVERTGARVVVSSTWRNGTLYDVLIKMLRQHGFTGEIIGKTGRRDCNDCLRGNQILRWMKDNVPDYHKFDRYVILDDDGDMLYWQRNNFIQTSSDKGGLTDKHMERAIDILTLEG